MKQLLFQPQAGIARGFAQMAQLMAATLGPQRGVIWNALGAGKPEALTDSGVIARRVTELSGAAENSGAMIMRGAATEMHERYLDGAALTAVLANALLDGAYRLIAAGVNPMTLRSGIDAAIRAAAQSILAAAQPVKGQERLAQIVLTATDDAELADILGELFDVLGRHGAYVVDEYAAPILDREYMDGGRWSARPASRELMPPAADDLVLENPLIFVSDDKLERFDQVAPALQLVFEAPDKTPILIIAREITGEALQALTLNHVRGRLTGAAALLLASGDALRADLEDVSLLVGGQLTAVERGTAPGRFRAEWFGRAQRVILKRDSLTIIGGAGDKRLMQRRAGDLRAQLKTIKTPDENWERLRLRIARLSGGMGVLKIGALTFSERDERKDRAKKAVRVLETALESGAVPGGGVALLHAIPAVCAAKRGAVEHDAGVDLVARALTAPFLQIVANTGHAAPQVALHAVQQNGGDLGFDARTGEYVSMWETGILDSAAILTAALQSAGSAAIMALTTDVVIVEK
ncbi:MAG: hypothetical protein IPO91_22265 [Chloroflexi bacterium]|nr:hypothetical protein [Chloroflexota bacterium]